MGGSKSQTVGHRYYVGLHLVFCHALDKLMGIKVGEKWAWEPDDDIIVGYTPGVDEYENPILIPIYEQYGAIEENTTLPLQRPDLFGGESREGGIEGDVDVCFGKSGQVPNDYLQSVLGSDIPAFRGLFGLIARKCMVAANNPYIKSWSALGQRTAVGWRDDLGGITASDGYVDMNPSHIMYETLTNTTWGGMGYPVSDLDMGAFLTAANLLKAEGLGLSLLWARNTSVEDFLKVILDHIDGKLFFSHVTGLLTIKLVRRDYSVGALPVVNESNIITLVEYNSPSSMESINQVTVNYVDRSNTPCAVTVQDNAGITRTGGQINAATIDFVGIATADMASKIAARELQQLCMPISSCVLEVNRKNWNLEPGDCFNFTWGPVGIENMAMRVDTVAVGVHTDNRLRITAVRDVYGLGTISLIQPGESGWISPATEPADAARRKISEITWWQFVQEFGDSGAVLAELDDTSTGVVACCARPSNDSIDFQLHTRNSGGTTWALRDTESFLFTGTLATAIGLSVTSVLQLQESAINTDLVRVGMYAALEEELVAITAIDTVNRTLTVDRGVLDTIPVHHAVGAYLWCHDGFYGLDQTQRAAGEVVQAKLLPCTSKGRLDIDDAAINSITCAGRMMRPYPPGAVRINGEYWPEAIDGYELTLTWAHRDRLSQTVALVGFGYGSIGPEAGVTYDVTASDAQDNVILWGYNMSGVTCTFDLSVFPSNVVKVRLWAKRNALTSQAVYEHTLEFELPEPPASTELTYIPMGYASGKIYGEVLVYAGGTGRNYVWWTSDYGESFTLENNDIGFSPSHILYGLGKYVAFGGSWSTWTGVASSIGGTWTSQNLGGWSSGIVFDGARFIIYGPYGLMRTSTNGSSWTTVTGHNLQGYTDGSGRSIYYSIIDMAWDGSNYYAMIKKHDSFGVIISWDVWKSSDLINWSKKYEQAMAYNPIGAKLWEFSKIRYVNGRIFVLGFKPNSFLNLRPLILTSTNGGDTWTDVAPTLPDGTYARLAKDIAWFSGKYVLLGQNIEGYSSDLITWTYTLSTSARVSINPAQNDTTLFAILYFTSPGSEISLDARVLRRTTDGITWSELDPEL